MTMIELAAEGLRRNQEMFTGTFADFSDAEILVRPCPGANHTAWQIGHLIASETHMVAAFNPAAIAPLPDGFDKKFTKETAPKDDAASFPTKSQLLDQFNKTRTATIAWAKSLTSADLDKPGPERMAAYIPTLAHALYLIPVHTAMHIGQMQVVRRKLGRPIMF